ncbi:MAG TPA: phosphatidate cytidylyltransferase [Casimicrobiaceae bacterium]|nr:phosphatidate cytidylyltransferase [Casimicrobiaceae bacterium]
MASALVTRIVTALVLIAVVLAALFLSRPLGWGVVVLLVVLGAAHEWARLAGFERNGWMVFVGGTLVLGINLLFNPVVGFEAGWPTGVVLAVCGAATLFWLLVATPWVLFRWHPASPLVLAIAGWVVLMGAFVAIVDLQARSPWLVLAAMAIVWIADTAAYFAGRQYGRHKLAPQISPGKTWEGVGGAVVAVACYAAALAPLASSAGYRGAGGVAMVALWMAFAVALALLSVIGDLYESLLKRHAGVKDSGALLPGHGGILDRVDALLAAMPPVSIAALLFLGRP